MSRKPNETLPGRGLVDSADWEYASCSPRSRTGTLDDGPSVCSTRGPRSHAGTAVWKLELGRPRIVVSVGDDADRLLDHLLRRALIPPPPLLMKVAHHAYIGSRARIVPVERDEHPWRASAEQRCERGGGRDESD